MVAAVAIRHALARRKVHVLLQQLIPERFALFHHRADVTQHAQIQVAPVSAGMCHELAQRRFASQYRQLGDIGANARIDIKLSVFGEQQRCETGEVLAGRADAHTRTRRIRDGQLHAREPEAPPVEQLAMLCNANHQTWRIAAIESRKDVVEATHSRIWIYVSHLSSPQSSHPTGAMARSILINFPISQFFPKKINSASAKVPPTWLATLARPSHCPTSPAPPGATPDQ